MRNLFIKEDYQLYIDIDAILSLLFIKNIYFMPMVKFTAIFTV